MMAGRETLHTLVLICAFLGFQRSQAQIFIGDKLAPGILYAPLPDPREDTNILDAEFTLINLPSGTRIDDLGYDPVDEYVYWCDRDSGRKISRVNLDGDNLEVLVSQRGAIDLFVDSVHRKIYWLNYGAGTISSADLNGTNVNEFYNKRGRGSPKSMWVDPDNGYMIWVTSDGTTKADLNGDNPEIANSISAPGDYVGQQCSDGTARLFYFTVESTLEVAESMVTVGVINLDGSNDTTLTVLEKIIAGSNTLNKYGSRLFWRLRNPQTGGAIYEYDIRSSETKMLNNTVKMKDGSSRTINPESIKIVANVMYDEPVTIEGCPNNIYITLTEGSNTSTLVSWPEPKLGSSLSSCPSLEFIGDISNGANVSLGVYDLSYVARDTAGNTEDCQFTVTVSDQEQPTTEQPGSMTSSECDSNQSGGGTTTFSFTAILRTLSIAFLCVITLT